MRYEQAPLAGSRRAASELTQQSRSEPIRKQIGPTICSLSLVDPQCLGAWHFGVCVPEAIELQGHLDLVLRQILEGDVYLLPLAQVR